jgi:hypothetical protein
MKNNTNKKENTMKNENTMNIKNDLVNEMFNFYNSDFILSDSYTVINSGLTHFYDDETITHSELNEYMHEYKDFKLESIIVIPAMSH